MQVPGQRIEPPRIIGRIDRRGALGRRAGGKWLDRARMTGPRCMSRNARGTPGAMAGSVDKPPEVRSRRRIVVRHRFPLVEGRR